MPLTDKQRLDEALELLFQENHDALAQGDREQYYYFTFGTVHEDHGTPMKQRFVAYHGTYAGARMQMLRRFGFDWAFQYGSLDEAHAQEYRLEQYKP